ncbi:hypothetical protein SH501x_004844 [Pirellulaceae bacterium SH501]
MRNFAIHPNYSLFDAFEKRAEYLRSFWLHTLSVVLLIESIICLLVSDDRTAARYFVAFGLMNTFVFVRLGGLFIEQVEYRLSIASLFYIASIVKCCISPLYVGACVSLDFQEHLVHFGPTNVEGYLSKGLFLVLIGDAVTIYMLFYKRSMKQTLIEKRENDEVVFRPTIPLFVLGLAWVLSISAARGLISIPTVLGNYFIVYLPPAVALMFFFHAEMSRKKGYAFVGYAVCLLTVLLSSTLVSKSSLIIPMLPALFYVLKIAVPPKVARQYFSKYARGIFNYQFLLVCVVILFAFPLVKTARQKMRFDSGSLAEVEITEILKGTFTTLVSSEESGAPFGGFPDKGFWSFFPRMSSITASSWAFYYVSAEGHLNGRIILESIGSFVPRFIWTEKPDFHPGKEIARLTGHHGSHNIFLDPGDNAGILYLNGGITLLIVGLVLNGVVLRWLDSLIMLLTNYNIFYSLAKCLIFTKAIQHFEGSFDGGIQLYVVTCSFLVCGYVFNKGFLGCESNISRLQGA